MKTLKTILVLATMLLTFDVSANPLPPGFEYVTSGAEYETYFNIRKKAIELIRNASKTPGNDLTAHAIEFGEKVIQRLLLSKFAISTNDASERRCSTKDMFVNTSFPNTIFICKVTRNAISDGNSKNLMIASQIFIHEGAHLVDYSEMGKSEECRPTYFELIVMKNNFGRHNIPSMGNRDTYKAQCGFAEYNDVPSQNNRVAGHSSHKSLGSR